MTEELWLPPGVPRAPTRKIGTKRISAKEIQEALRATNARPRKVGDGPADFTPSVALDIQPFRWDGNSFYARLGLTPGCARVEIARALLELDPRQSFLQLAHAAHVLIDKSKRRVYDAMMLGHWWADDPDLQQQGEELTSVAPPVDWAVYADPEVTDAEAKALDPAWRTLLSQALAPRLAHLPALPGIAIGATRDRPRWEQIGLLAVLFVRVDEETTEEYVERAAEHLLRISTPVRSDRGLGGIR